jgi:hypothetical protein
VVSCTDAQRSVSLGGTSSKARIWLTTLGAVDAAFAPRPQVADRPSDPATPVWLFIYEGDFPMDRPDTRLLHVADASNPATRDGAFIYLYRWSELGSPTLPATMPAVAAALPGASRIAVPTQSPPPSVGTPGTCMTALIDGDLVADATYGIALDDLHAGFVRKVIWPYGFVAARDGDRLALLDGAGQIVAHEGDRVQLGGGEISSDGPWLTCGGITVVHRSN